MRRRAVRAAGAWSCPTVPLTVPLLCSGGGFEGKGLHEVDSGLARGQSLEDSPEVNDISLDSTFGIETLEDVFLEMDAEGASFAWVVFGVKRAGPTALAAAAAELGEQAQVFE